MRIKNWEKFQHFTDRRPPWIKLYRDLLDDHEWYQLDDSASRTLVMLWLLASEDKTQTGLLPSSLKAIAFRLRLSEKELTIRLTRLSHWVVQDDIALISDRNQSVPPETETYSKETETECALNKNKKEEFETGFLEFYVAYPKKKAKRAAAKAYAGARRHASHEQIMAGLANAKKLDHRFQDPKFTPFPASWLNSGSYADEVDFVRHGPNDPYAGIT